MARLGVQLHMTEQMIDKRREVSGFAGIYKRYKFLDEMKETLASYEAHLVGAIKV